MKTEIDIFIKNEQPDVRDVRNENPKGILPVSYNPKRLARRLVQNKIFLRLIDVGQFADLGEISFVFNANPALIVNPFSNAYQLDSPFNYAADFNSFVLGYDFQDWGETFREIENPYYYGVAVNEIFSEAASPVGFEVEAASGISVSGGRAFQYFNTNNTGPFKVTTEPSFGAAEVPFVLDKSCEVFLMPLVMRWTGRADIWLQPREFSFPRYDYLLNGFYKAIPRSVLTTPNFDAEFGVPFFRYSTNPSVTALPLKSADFRADWKGLNTLDPASSLIEVRYNGSFGYRNWEFDQTLDPSLFPTNETPDVYVNPTGTIPTYRPYCWIYDNIMPGGLLCGAIKKENDWFFVWSRAGNSNLSAGGYLIAV